MEQKRLSECYRWILDEQKRCVEFWLQNGMDQKFGGVYTCLDRTGAVYSTDKSVWMQGRCGWIFAWLCHVYGARREWLDASRSCIEFMEKHCFNPAAPDRMYFTVTAEGKPLRQRRYYFSEAFCAMANAEYYGVTGDKTCLNRARREYDLYWNLSRGMKDPTGLGPKTDPATRSGRSFGIPMILLNVSSVLIRTDPERRELYEERSRICVEEIFKYHVHPELNCVLENTGPHGEARLDISEGRIVNPGHDIEFVWFLLEYAQRTGEKEWIPEAETIFNNAMKAGWDEQYGGLLYFTDCKNLPREACEHDMKLWWPHNEILISSLMLCCMTGKEEYLNWFFRVLDYSREHLSDTDYGEWYGYLRRDGKPTEPACKGTTYKGPFHLPRMLTLCQQMLQKQFGLTEA